MQLELDGKKKLENPDEQVIASALAGMKWEAILRRDEVSYVRTSMEADEGFPLEYQEDSTENHFQAVGNSSRARVTQAFIAFSKSDASWKTGFEWVKATKEAEAAEDASENLGCGVFLFLGGAIMIAGQLGWIPKLDWFFPGMLMAWGIAYLYDFFKKRHPPR